MVRRLQVKLVTAEARAAAAQSNEAAIIEALKQADERHSQELKEAHLVSRARRRMQAFENEELPILEEHPVARGSGKRKSPTAPVAPPPTEASRETPDPKVAKEEEPLPLTLPGPRVDVRSLLLSIGREPTPASDPA